MYARTNEFQEPITFVPAYPTLIRKFLNYLPHFTTKQHTVDVCMRDPNRYLHTLFVRSKICMCSVLPGIRTFVRVSSVSLSSDWPLFPPPPPPGGLWSPRPWVEAVLPTRDRRSPWVQRKLAEGLCNNFSIQWKFQISLEISREFLSSNCQHWSNLRVLQTLCFMDRKYFHRWEFQR
jgi:hypothetical protein